jgi:hypothetical protein
MTSTTDHSASVEWLAPDVGLLRVHEGDGGRFGDPYVWCCTVVREYHTAKIKGVDATPSPSIVRAVKACLASQGMSRREYDRISGRPRSVVNSQRSMSSGEIE